MKKIISLLLILGLLLTGFPLACASSLPAEISAYFEDPQFAECEIGDWDIGYDFCFVNLVDHRGINVLHGFRYTNGSWNHFMNTHKAVPQGGGTLRVVMDNEYRDHRTGEVKYDYPTLRLDAGSEIAWYCYTGSRIWKLMRYQNDGKSLLVTVGDKQISYFTGSQYGKKKGTVEGSVQRDLRYASLSAIPTSYDKAQGHLTVEPDLPASSSLTAYDVTFPGGKKYPVYSAPSKDSLRSANGKAAVSTNSWIQVFGTEDGFALVHYSIDASRYRFGYIEEKYLPKSADVPALSFDFTDVTVNSDVSVTDDPFYSQSVIATLDAGDEVIYLASIGNWAYIESTEGLYYRGFIPLSVLSTQTEDDSEG